MAIAILVVLAVKMVVLWLLEWEDVSVSREFDNDRHGGGSVRRSKRLNEKKERKKKDLLVVVTLIGPLIAIISLFSNKLG